MALDDLLKGIAVFNDGLKTYAVSRGVNDANEKLAQVNQAEMSKMVKPEEALMAKNQISSELGMRLSAAGADASAIGAAREAIAPSLGAQYQAEQSKEMQASSQGFNASESEKERKLRWDIANLDKPGASAAQEKKLLAGFAEKFRKENKDMLGARDKLEGLKSILDKTPDRVGVEMAKTGLLKFAGEDRVSDADVARAQRDPSLRAGIARRLKLEATGEALADDRKFYQMILDHAGKKMQEQLRGKIKGYSEGTAELAEVDGSKLQSGLMKQLGVSDAPAPKTLVKKLFSSKLNKTRLVYSDGTEEIQDGRK
jgi:hypothetical protein